MNRLAQIPADAVAIVFGGAGAIGSSVSHRLAQAGYRVVVHVRSNASRSAALVESLPGGPHLQAVGDLAHAGVAEQCVADATKGLGAPPLVAVALASTAFPSEYISDTSDARVEEHLDTLRIHHHIYRAVVPAMREHGAGRIVSVTGALASRPFAGLSMQAAIRAAVNVTAQTLALEEGRHGITVNAVAPGHVRVTDGTHSTTGDQAYASLDRLSELRRALPQFPTASDIADVVAFLVSESGRAVTGQVIHLAAGEPM